jgi:hypothetical protein
VSSGDHGAGSSRRHYGYEGPRPDNGYE